MNKIVSAHQIEHLIWLGLLDKISQANAFILCDTMQFKKEYFEHRNKIRTKDGWQWIIVSVEDDTHKPMKEIKISNNRPWKRKYLNSIKQNYSKAPYYNQLFPIIEEIINKNHTHLIDLNKELLNLFLKWYGIKPEIIMLSDLNIDNNLKSTDLLIEMAKKSNADVFLAGPSGKDYIKQDKFKEAGIGLDFHHFECPIYKQQFEPFMRNLSALDYFFNNGVKND
jgi:hypothetical protein